MSTAPQLNNQRFYVPGPEMVQICVHLMQTADNILRAAQLVAPLGTHGADVLPLVQALERANTHVGIIEQYLNAVVAEHPTPYGGLNA